MQRIGKIGVGAAGDIGIAEAAALFFQRTLQVSGDAAHLRCAKRLAPRLLQRIEGDLGG